MRDMGRKKNRTNRLLFRTLPVIALLLALLVVTVWLARKKVNIIFTALPMVFMIAMTVWGMSINLESYYNDAKWLLFSIGSIITILQTWMIIEGIIVLARLKRNG